MPALVPAWGGAGAGPARPVSKRSGIRAGALVLAVACIAGGLVPTATAQVRATSDYLERMDLDGDGRVSLDEYLDWMGYAFHGMDRNGDGVLQPDELPGGRGRALTLAQHRERLSATFARQDVDRDGYLSAKELAAPPQP